MASHAPAALDYEVGTAFYPRLRDAPRWWLILSSMLFLPVALGWWMVSRSGVPGMWWIGALYLGMSVLILLGLTLLYIPAASWLCVSRTGITMSVAFWRRFASWSRVRDVRLVVIDGPITSEPVIEVVFNESSASWLRWRLDSQRGFWLINVRLFGWSPDMLIGEMKRWQRGHAGA